jgi:hypothetical protein
MLFAANRDIPTQQDTEIAPFGAPITLRNVLTGNRQLAGQNKIELPHQYTDATRYKKVFKNLSEYNSEYLKYLQFTDKLCKLD